MLTYGILYNILRPNMNLGLDLDLVDLVIFSKLKIFEIHTKTDMLHIE